MRVLAVGAHPDDLELLCGGTVAKMVARGDEVMMLHATDGAGGAMDQAEQASLVARRNQEAKNSAAIAGAQHATTNLPDGGVHDSDEARLAMTRVIAEFAPDLVLTHHPLDYHADHRAVSHLVFSSSFAAANPLLATTRGHTFGVPALYYFDTLNGSGITPTEYVDITAFMDTKVDMLRCHESQLSFMQENFDSDLVEHIRIVALYRGLQSETKFAEAFEPARDWHRVRTSRLLP